MKKLSLMIATAALALVSVTPVRAESDTMRMSIPFAFVAGEHQLPAGDYFVTVDSRFNFAELRAIGTADIVRIAFKPAPVSRATTESGLLTFARYGSSHVLKGVWKYGRTLGYEVRTSKAEVKLAVANANPGAGAVTSTSLH